MELDNNYWREVPGYDGLYFVNKLGFVYRTERIVIAVRQGSPVRRIKSGGILSEEYRTGYPSVTLISGKKTKHETIHRLVAKSFLEPIEGKNFVNHKNGIKSDAFYRNVEWCTVKENHDHAIRTGLDKGIVGEMNNNSKLNTLQVRIIRRLIGQMYQREISEIFGIRQNVVSKIKLLQTWSSVDLDYKIAKNKPFVGSQKPMAKLTEKEVLEIRSIRGMTQTKIGQMFGIGPGMVSMIINRKIWKHI